MMCIGFSGKSFGGLLASCVFVLALSACGGGGGDVHSDLLRNSLVSSEAPISMKATSEEQACDAEPGDNRMVVSAKFNLRIFSRANCINNESITYDRNFAKWDMAVDSEQTSSTGQFELVTCEVHEEWRCGAVKWGGGLSCDSWTVEGWHYVTFDSAEKLKYLKERCDSDFFISSGRLYSDLCAVTHATGCNLGSW